MESADAESYWTRSISKGFSFDEEDGGGLVEPSLGGDIEWESNSVLNSDACSEASFSNSGGDTLNLSIKSVISEEALKVLLEEQTMDNHLIPKGVTPEEELKLLRRQIQIIMYSPSPDVTAYKMLLGKDVSLEVYKSLQEKQQLLDVVLRNGDGDSILGVVLFLRKTLNRKNFHQILQRHPKALQHYLSYLRQCSRSEALEVLQLFGRQQEAVLMQFERALAVDDLKVRKVMLEKLLEEGSKNATGVMRSYQQIFHSSSKIVEFVERERKTFDYEIDVNSTPIELLYACCHKHNNWKDQDLLRYISPFRLCSELHISPGQFQWSALNERSYAHAYGDLEQVFEHIPNWLPIKQKQFRISFSLDKAILRLHRLNAPQSVLHMFLSKMQNPNEKLLLAEQVNCVKSIIDALVSLKDVNRLLQFKETLHDRSEDKFFCDKAIQSLQNKRWTTDNIKFKI